MCFSINAVIQSLRDVSCVTLRWSMYRLSTAQRTTSVWFTSPLVKCMGRPLVAFFQRIILCVRFGFSLWSCHFCVKRIKKLCYLYSDTLTEDGFRNLIWDCCCCLDFLNSIQRVEWASSEPVTIPFSSLRKCSLFSCNYLSMALSPNYYHLRSFFFFFA